MHGLQVLLLLLSDPRLTTAAALVLAGLFGWSGSFKLARPGPIAIALVHFGLTPKSNRVLGRALGSIEFGVAITLVLPPSRRVAAVIAVALTVGFFLVIARTLWRGHEFSCACLGSEEQVSSSSLWRAGLMAAAASLVAVAPLTNLDPAGWMQAVLLAAVATGVPILERTRRRLGDLRRHLDERLDWNWILQTMDADRHGEPAGISGASRP